MAPSRRTPRGASSAHPSSKRSNSSITREQLQQSLELRHEMLEKGEAALAKGNLAGGELYLRASGNFRLALEAAGLAAAAEEPEATVNKYLRAAARAAPLIFEAGSTQSRVTELTSGETEEMTDTSEASAWTLVQGLYAALAAGDKKSERELAKLPEQAYQTEQVTISAVAQHFVRALQLAVAGDSDEALKELNAAEKAGKHSRTPGKGYWMSQVTALQHLLDKDDESFESDLEQVGTEIEKFYAKKDFSSEAHLRLPVRGLTALGKRSG